MSARREPTPGSPISRGGKPWIYATWLAKLLGGDSCVWSAWFKARYRYAKCESPDDLKKLQEWNQNHSRLMRGVHDELVENGWSCAVESQNEFVLVGQAATVKGKPDLIATMPGHALIVDGKTGQPRESDWWQVAIYLFACRHTRPDLLGGDLAGEVRYAQQRPRHIRLRDVTDARADDIVQMVKRIAGQEPPRAPSRGECARCNIGPQDCPQRFQSAPARATTTGARF